MSKNYLFPFLLITILVCVFGCGKDKEFDSEVDIQHLILRELQLSYDSVESKGRTDFCIRYREFNLKTDSATEIMFPYSRKNKKCKAITQRSWLLDLDQSSELFFAVYGFLEYYDNHEKEVSRYWSYSELIVETFAKRIKVKFESFPDKEPLIAGQGLQEGHWLTLLVHYIVESVCKDQPQATPVENPNSPSLKEKILNLFELADFHIRRPLAISYYILWKDLSIFEKTGYLKEKKHLLEFVLKDEVPTDEKNALIIGELQKISSADDVVNSVDMLKLMAETMPDIMCDEKVQSAILRMHSALESKPDYLGESLFKEYKKKLDKILSGKSCP